MKLGVVSVAAAIFALVAAVYSVSVANEFVRYDDMEYVVKNKALGDGLTPRAVIWSFRSAGYASNFHPLAWVSHAADISLAKLLGIDYREEDADGLGLVTKQFGAFPHLVHAVNVFFHALNAVLLWWLLMTVAATGCRGGRDSTGAAGCRGDRDSTGTLVAALLTLFWALHPLRVEVVAWVSERKELLSVTFMLLTLILWLRNRERSAVFCFVCALLAKPMAVSLPCVLFAWEWAIRRRTFAQALGKTWALGVSAAAICVLTVFSQRGAIDCGLELTWLQRIFSSVEAPVIYVAQTFWPVGLSIDYLLPDWSSWPWLVGGVLLLLAMSAAAGWFVWLKVRRRPVAGWLAWAVFAIAWIYVGLVPVLGIVKVGYEPHSDRYTYWVTCGAIVCVFVLAMRFFRRWEPYFRNVCLGFAGALVTLSVLTVFQCRVWYDTESLFSRIVYKTWSDEFARALAEDIYFKDHRRGPEAEAMLREVLDRQRTPLARASLALHLAAFGPRDSQTTMAGEDVSFAEARLLAGYALEEPGRGHDVAYAALAFADYRDEKYREAVDWMQKAKDLGFANGFLKIDLDEWRKKAAEQEAKKAAGKDAEKNVQKP